MSKLNSKCMAILGVVGLIVLWGVTALNLPNNAYAADTKPTVIVLNQPNNPPQPKSTPENGGRNCAVSKIVGYVMPNGEQQFYYVDDHGHGIKVGSVSGNALRAFLNSAVGSQGLGNPPDPDRVLGDPPDPDRVLGNPPDPDRVLGNPPDPDRVLGNPPDPDRVLGNPPDPDRNALVLTNQGGFVFTVQFNGADAICSRADFK